MFWTFKLRFEVDILAFLALLAVLGYFSQIWQNLVTLAQTNAYSANTKLKIMQFSTVIRLLYVALLSLLAFACFERLDTL
jgi:hypothetical protein